MSTHVKHLDEHQVVLCSPTHRDILFTRSKLLSDINAVLVYVARVYRICSVGGLVNWQLQSTGDNLIDNRCAPKTLKTLLRPCAPISTRDPKCGNPKSHSLWVHPCQHLGGSTLVIFPLLLQRGCHFLLNLNLRQCFRSRRDWISLLIAQPRWWSTTRLILYYNASIKQLYNCFLHCSKLRCFGCLWRHAETKVLEIRTR